MMKKSKFKKLISHNGELHIKNYSPRFATNDKRRLPLGVTCYELKRQRQFSSNVKYCVMVVAVVAFLIGLWFIGDVLFSFNS